MNKLILSSLLFLLSLSLISSATICDESCGSCLGVFKQGEIISLYQLCDTCTYVNITSVTHPDSTISKIEITMTKSGVDYNYTYTGTHKVGDYSYKVCGDKDGSFECEDICFKITPSGTTDNSAFYIIIIALSYGIAFIGFFGKNEWITIIGGLAMLGVGVYFITNGIIIYRDVITLTISYFTIALGGFLALYTTYELLQENY